MESYPPSNPLSLPASPTLAKADETCSMRSTMSSTHSNDDGSYVVFPQGRCRLSHVFVLQVLLVMGCFGSTLSYLFISLRSEIDQNMYQIINGVMVQYENALLPPLHSATRVSARLYDELPLRSLTIPRLDNTSLAAHLGLYAAYRQALRELPFSPFIYEDIKTSVWDPIHGSYVWDETVCGTSSCWRVVNNSALLVTLTRDEGLLPNNFSQQSLDSAETINVAPNAEAYYLESIQAIPVGHPTGMWGVPYVWLEDNISKIFLLQPYMRCFAWAISARSECTHSITVETSLQLLTESLRRISTAASSTTALVHMNTMRLLSSTIPGLPLINLTGITSIEDVYGTSLLSTRMWDARATPSALLNAAVTSFVAACVASTVLHKTIGDSSVHRVTYRCRRHVPRLGDYIVGMNLIQVDDDSQFLFIDMTHRSYFYASADAALRNTIIVAAVVCAVVVLVVAQLLFSVTRAMRTLLDNIHTAELLDYEGVTEESMMLYEMQRVHDAFMALNARLLQTRAFLPQSLFGKNGLPRANVVVVPQTGNKSSDVDDEGRQQGPAVGDSRDVPVEVEVNSTPTHPCKHTLPHFSASSSAGRSSSCTTVEVEEETFAPTGDGAARGQRGRVALYPRPQRLNLSSSLASRRVTVVCGNAVGTHSTFRDQGAAVTQHRLSALLNVIEEAVASQRGVIDTYHGDRVMVSFNASNTLTASGPRAARSILHVHQALRDNPALPGVRWGVSTGNAVCGNFGTQRTRRFCVCGPVVNQAFALMLHCRAENVSNLVAPLSYDVMKDDFIVEHRNLVALTVGEAQTTPTVISTIRRERLRSLSASRALGEFAPQSSTSTADFAADDAIDLVNTAFEALDRGDLDEASVLAARLPPHGGKQLRQLLEMCSR